jgi:hypothetical protein
MDTPGTMPAVLPPLTTVSTGLPLRVVTERLDVVGNGRLMTEVARPKLVRVSTPVQGVDDPLRQPDGVPGTPVAAPRSCGTFPKLTVGLCRLT